MKLYMWDQRFSVGDATIDQQHQQLFLLIQKLDEKINVNQDLTISRKDFNEIKQYMLSHFDYELNEYRQLGCSTESISLHHKQHLSYNKFIERFEQQYFIEKNTSISSIKTLISYLREWLFNHILKNDREMITQVRQLDFVSIKSVKEETISELESRTRLFTDNLPACTWIADSNRKRTYANEYFLKLFNVKNTALDDWVDNISADDAERYFLCESQAMNDEKTIIIVYAVTENESRKTVWLKEHIIPRRGTDGHISGLLGVAIDITEQQEAIELKSNLNKTLENKVQNRTEILLKQNNRLIELTRTLSFQQEKHDELNIELNETKSHLIQTEKMAAIGHLAAGVAHEINNPVGYVTSNMNALSDYLNDLLTLVSQYEEAFSIDDASIIKKLKSLKEQINFSFIKEDALDLIEESKIGLKKIQKIISDLKDFSREEHSHWSLANINEIVQSAINIVNNEIKYKAEIVKNFAEIPDVYCLPNELGQVFMNLLVNAAQAIESTGVINVTTQLEGDFIVIKFRDDGEGISIEDQKKIFDPFFTTKPVGKGTGLGLSISYAIIGKHEGEIRVESEPGKGAFFNIRIPVKLSITVD